MNRWMRSALVCGVLMLCCVVSVQAAPKIAPDIVVSQDGQGDFDSVQAAIDSVPAGNTERIIIGIRNGTYNEKIRLENSFITLQGEDRHKTRLVWKIEDPRNDPNGNADGKGIASFNLRDASDIVIENLTIENPATMGKKPITVFSSGKGTRIVIQNAEILGTGGDTLSLWTHGMYYHRDLHVTGTYHFVGPRGTCYMADSLIEEVGDVRNALFNEGMMDERQKFVLKNCKIISEQEFGLGSSFRDAAWYFVGCEFPDTLKADGQIFIQQSNPNQPKSVEEMFKWDPNRVYFANCTGPDYEWLKDNIDQSPAESADVIDAAWTFYGEWDPESTAPVEVKSVERDGRVLRVKFGEPVTVKGRTSVEYEDGATGKFLSGSGTDTLEFAAPTQSVPLGFRSAVIVASQAGAQLRTVEPGVSLER